MNISTKESAKAQEIQDRIFRKMTVEKKLEMMNDFFLFAKELNLINKNYDRKKSSLSFFKERVRVRLKIK